RLAKARSHRLHGPARQSLRQRQGRELHEDTQGRSRVSDGVRNLRGRYSRPSPLHRRGLQHSQTPLRARLSERNTRIATPSNLSKPPPETVHYQGRTPRCCQSLRGLNRRGGKMNGNEIDMRMFAQRAGANVTFSAGSVVFNQGDPGSCMYIVQSGVIEMVIGDKVIEVCGPNEAIGFMSMVDDAPRSSTARVKEACELSVIDQRKFRFMIDEVPNFALYIMGAMARRIRGMSQAM